MISCMGGWCAGRDSCANYYAESNLPVERLCGGREEPEYFRGSRCDGQGLQTTASKVVNIEPLSAACVESLSTSLVTNGSD